MAGNDTPYTDAYKRKIALRDKSSNSKKGNFIKSSPKGVRSAQKASAKASTLPQVPSDEGKVGKVGKIKGIEDFAHKQEVKLEKKFGKKKVRKFEHYVVISIYVIIIAVAGYFFLINDNPDLIPGDFYKYEITASDSMITSNFRSLYLEDGEVFGGEAELDNGTGRLVVLEKPFNFIFNPKREIPEGSSAEIRLEFVKPSTEVYLNDKLIIPDLDGFEKIADFENDEVWVRDKLTMSNYAKGKTPEEFVYANFPGKDMYAFGELTGGTPVISGYTQTNTFIGTRFRGDLKLAVYAEGNLEMEFIKQDSNWAIGKDEYTVEITDLQGNSYYKNIYGDDGNKKDNGEGEFEQRFTLTGKDLPRNIYYITFTRDENNKWEDSSIKDIRINSNKVLIIGAILPMGGYKFYTEIEGKENIRFRTYWEDKILINIEGNLEEIFTVKKGDDYFLNLSTGKYTLENDKWKVWISQKPPFSPSESRWFYLPEEGAGKLIDQDIIIIDKNQLKIDGEEVIYTGRIDVETGSKIKIQVLDKLETYFKGIKLVL